MRTCTAALLAAGFFATTLFARPAAACEHAIQFQVNEMLQLLVKAERLLDSKPHWAFAKAMTALLDLEDDDLELDSKYKKKKAALFTRRARRVAALAAVRRDGKVNIKLRVSVKRIKPDKRLQNLEWALGILKKQYDANKTNPVLAAGYAEALARFPARRPEARKILAGLASRDIMPYAFAFRVLAELEHGAGNATARDAAIGRCRTMSKKQLRASCGDFLVHAS